MDQRRTMPVVVAAAALMMIITMGKLLQARTFGERDEWGMTRLLQEQNNNDEGGNASNNSATGGGVRYMRVDVDGGAAADFTSIQAAIDSVPDSNIIPTLIHIFPGIYDERVVVPSTKPFITLQGSGMNVTFVQWHLKASDTDEHGMELTAYNTASVTVHASNFVAKGITFKNTLPPPPPGIEGRQAAAFRISGDMAAFYECGFVGGQDTLCDDQGRHYFEDCFIQGSIDFVFGNARSLYNCDGPGADESQRVAWSHELNDEEVIPFLNMSFIDGDTWLPQG
ncbi:hypothetical protein L7F22_042436 [Adiantum nelumboides]|nr:hypothetical protein [Adiantum nelumboides]